MERNRDRAVSRDLHAVLHHAGYVYQLSFYGTLKEPYDGRHNQARIEILSTDPFTLTDIIYFRDCLRHFKPDREYTLLAVSDQGLKEVKNE